MWIELRVYSVRANSQAGNIRLYKMTTKKDQHCKLLNWQSKKFTHLARTFVRECLAQERALLELQICLWEYTWKANLEIHLPSKCCCNFV